MSTTALYALAAEYRDAASKLADLDLDPQTLADTLESLSGDLEVKATNVAMFIRNMDVSIEAMKAAEKTMGERRKSAERRRDRKCTEIRIRAGELLRQRLTGKHLDNVRLAKLRFAR